MKPQRQLKPNQNKIREEIGAGHHVPMAGRSEIFCVLLWANTESKTDGCWVEFLGKKPPIGLCPRMNLLCQRRASMRGWVIALSCCGTLGSDEGRVPVVKKAKDQVFINDVRAGL